ncbi:MBL fold metallo-hydrolase [Achromobacter seleniivolatilans]|uniref:MBL fold metallo-hydrolase n=1 Tax=Achromobacter seleniivolatilans TaxID=3047478 RepID=A0ABY9LZD1_9BURK|nr:MBL fold metallo-hydrolase [Achromobacter sp. R39]WMD19713.1 MBL fold metallo-hydrolase [Achromobacter sp. R39]
MQRLKALGLALSFALGAANVSAHAAGNADATTAKPTLQIQQIRNATAKINYAGKTFLVDPFLAKKGEYPGFEGTFHSELRNPLVELPMSADEVLKGVDAVIVSHTHLDHWDGGAHSFIPKAIPLFVQDDADAKQIRGQGYTNVQILGKGTVFEGVQLTKIGGQHGTDEMYAVKPLATMLGEAMGIVFQSPGEKTVYVVGDTVWRHEVDQTLATFKPDVIVMNTGDARVVGFMGSIIMGKDDVLHAYQAMPKAIIVATHMDAINHMTLSRKELKDHVQQHGIQDRVRIPEDGEILKF